MGAFKKNLTEAIALHAKLEEDEKRRKLTAAAFKRRAEEIAGTTDKELDNIEKAIAANPKLYPHIFQFVDTATRWIREATCSCPPTETRRLTWLSRHEEALNTELVSISSNLFELFALAVKNAIKKHPEAFGTVEDMDEHQRELKDNQAKLAELYKKIEGSYTPDDLVIDDSDSKGRARVSLRITRGDVNLTPGFAQNLVSWLRSHPEVRL